MLTYPDIDPIAFTIGPLAVHWYGLMYLVGFIGFWVLGVWQVRHRQPPLSEQQVGDLLFFAVIAVVIGGRLGYMLFYHPGLLAQEPLSLFRIWEGGMSFHGGLVGVLLTLWYYGHRTGAGFLRMGDFAAPMVPIGLGAGRIGNFINGELWGRVTDLPWGMVFPHVGPRPRHPSQLYEAFLEGVVLFTVLWLFARRPRPTGAISGLFLLLYGLLRFLVEFFRAPDPHMGFIAFGWLTMGQALSLPMALAGAGLLWWAYRWPIRSVTP